MEQYNCHRCNTQLNVGEVSNEEYFASCPKCDEDMYEFECIKITNTMENIREKAKEVLQWYSEIDKEEAIDAMIEFAHQMCEEQKKVCANVANAELVYDEDFLEGIGCSVNHEEILNAPNVCQK